ncbi:zf-HC2 domain-containing protein [Actinophytocola sp. NPDC049390]|uniref:zf-HC2 domain-containing protein n=1 Tax=Actinophytocola sp. NPDC049390 TaxID=3363894 RepID=UPI00378C7220
MECLTCRESLSARLDGEDEPVPAARVDAHLAECGACRAWLRRAEELNRLVRVRPAAPVPDLSAAVLADAPVLGPAQGWGIRGALVCVAVAQVTLGLSQLVGVGTTATHVAHGVGPAVAGHLFNESVAWNLALGIGMLWAAFRPQATTGLVPMLAAFLVVLVAYSTHDLVTGAAPVSRVLGHGLLVVGLVLMVIVNRRHRPDAPESARAPQPGTGHGTAAGRAEPSDLDVAGPTGRPHLRPAGRAA